MIMSMFAVPALGAPKRINRVPDSYEPSGLTATAIVSDLIAGKNTDVGDLFINALGDNEYLVTYKLAADNYYFGEIHFEAINDENKGFTDDSAIIYSKGGIIPGKLTVNESFDMPEVDPITGDISGGTQTYSFIYTSGAPVDSFAAHSVVCLATAESYDDTIVGSRTDTGYIASGAIEDQVVEVREPFGYPDPTNDYTSEWDIAFSASPLWASKLIASGAQFVWNYELSSGLTGTPVPTSNDLTVYGDVCNIDVDVTVPEDATDISATLYIVADNGYIAKINDTIINHAGFNVAAYAALTPETEVATETNALLLEVFPTLRANAGTQSFFPESVVPTNAWNSMIAVGSNVPLVAGNNTINIAAMNEQMDGGNDYSNPAGVIYFIEYSWKVPTYTTVTRYRLATDCETAWGAGDDVAGGNWSMIIPRNKALPFYKFIEHVDVSSLNGAGVDTTAVLEDGKQYQLRASGTFDYSSDIYDEADAEWFEKSGGWIKGETGVYADKTNVIDVSVNGDPANDDWGDYNPAHEYTMNYIGAGSVLHLYIFDTNYTDNSGSIHVDIYEVQW